jgi:hypothetical protein
MENKEIKALEKYQRRLIATHARACQIAMSNAQNEPQYAKYKQLADRLGRKYNDVGEQIASYE